MERLSRTLAGCGLALALAVPGAGCRSTRSEVPPRPAFSGDGKQVPPVGFSSAANPDPLGTLSAAGGNVAPGGRSGAGQFGTPPPGAGNMGVPAGPTYGPPGTVTAPAASAGGSAPTAAADPSAGAPQSGTGPTEIAPGVNVIGSPGASGAAPTAGPFDR